METIALNCLVFEKVVFLQFGDRQTNKQTDKQTKIWTRPLREAALAVASGGLINEYNILRKRKVNSTLHFQKNQLL